MAAVTFCDSSCVRVLVAASLHGAEQGTDVAVTTPSAAVKRVWDIIGTDRTPHTLADARGI